MSIVLSPFQARSAPQELSKCPLAGILSSERFYIQGGALQILVVNFLRIELYTQQLEYRFETGLGALKAEQFNKWNLDCHLKVKATQINPYLQSQ